MTLSIGVDPSTKRMAIAGVYLTWENLPKARFVDLIKPKGKKSRDRAREMALSIKYQAAEKPDLYQTADILVVEWQEIRMSRQGIDRIRPQSLMEVGIFAGMVIPLIGDSDTQCLFPTGAEWIKPSKEVCRRRILKTLNMTLDSPMFKHIAKSHMPDVLDSLGLALWGLRHCGETP